MSFCKIKCGCLIAITLFSVVYGMVKIKETTTERDFNDVLVNISKVNGMIQELIHNYKQLEKMTNSDLESDYDEKQITLSRELEKENRDRAKTERKHSKTSTTEHRGLVTAMIISDGEPGLERDNDGKKGKGKSRKPKHKRKPAKNSVQDNKYKTDETIATGNDALTPEVKIEDSKFTFEDNALVVDDSVVKPRSRATNAFTPSILDYLFTTTTMYPKVVGNLIDIRQSTPSKKHLEPRLDNYDSTWTGIRKHNRDKSRRKPRIIYLKNSKKSKREGFRSATKKTETQDSKSVWEGDKVIREEKRINTLRQAYGDACMRLVVRKCYMACKGVSRDTCHGKRLCSKKFTAAFKKNAIQGCDKEFGHNKSANFRAETAEANEGGFVDMTRDGYLAMACLPGETAKIAPRQKRLRIKINPQRRHKVQVVTVSKNEHIEKPDKSLMILRDRYEEACSRESAKRCFRACKNAVNAAIEEESRKSKKKDFMMKSCKKRCSKAYHAKGYSDSSSSSDSSDASSSESRSKKRKSGEW